MAKTEKRSTVGPLVALATGLLLILIPEPATTALGTAIVIGTIGIQATK
jgi:hypothetical protein